MKKILSVGSATQDIFLLYEGAETLHLHLQKKDRSFLLFEQGTKIDIPALHYATGGGATNAGVGFKRLGLKAELFFKIGNDVAGTFVYEELLKEKVGMQYSIIDPSISTAISFIVPSIEHNNVALCYRGAHTRITREEFPFKDLKNFNYLYIGPLQGRSGLLLPLITARAKELGIPVATNPGMGQIMHQTELFASTIASLDILIVNAYEAAHLLKALTGSKAPFKLTDYFNEIFKRGPTGEGPSIAVVTNGAKGVYAATEEARYFHPSLKARVVSGLGAGDAFSSAFVGSLALGQTLEQAIIYGIINAHSVIQCTDAKEGLLTLQELEQRAKLVGRGKLQKRNRKKAIQ